LGVSSGMTIKAAIEKGYSPCLDCMYENKEESIASEKGIDKPLPENKQYQTNSADKVGKIEEKSIALHEITMTDIFSSVFQIKSSNISMLGISLDTKIGELLSKYNKSNEDLTPTFDKEGYTIDIDDIVFYTKDKNRIDCISIYMIADENNRFIGETKRYFGIKLYEDFSAFLMKKLGKPKYIYHFENIIDNSYSYYYPSGIKFRYSMGSSANAIGISIYPEKDLDNIAKKEKAKTPEEIQRIESKPIPLSKNGFRKTLWGMTKEQVKKTETSEYLKEIKGGDTAGLEILMFKSNIDGLNCLIAYYFGNNRLTRARYIVIDKHSNRNLYINDYDKMKNSLSAKYGRSFLVDGPIWADDLYKDRPDDYGIAISTGHLKYIADWENEESYIELLLRGDNSEISLWAEYIGKTFMVYEKSITEKAKKGLW